MKAVINGVALLDAGEELEDEALRERAWAELLRQEAVRAGLLPAGELRVAPALGATERAAIHAMLDDSVPLPQPGETECARYYAAHRQRFTRGRRAHVRHILFAVTGGVDVRALAARAERALLELAHASAPAERFAELARQFSNCPSGAQGGDLGWIAPEDCAEEFAAALFDEGEGRPATGLLHRLVHSRHGFHIVDVLAREPGEAIPYEQLRERIAVELAQRSRATALHQYIRLLAGRARIEGVALEAVASPLIQ